MCEVKIYKVNNTFFATKWEIEFTKKWFHKRYNYPVVIKEYNINSGGLWEVAASFKNVKAFNDKPCIKFKGVRMKCIGFKDLIEVFNDEYLKPVEIYGFEKIEHEVNLKVLNGGF